MLKGGSIMKKSILKIDSVTKLTVNEQKGIRGGKTKDWDLCCLKEDSSELPPLGCESWIICDGF